MSTLTDAQILDLTGDEPALTDADRRAAVTYFLGGGCWYGEWLLAGGERAAHIRSSSLGTFGWLPDGSSVSCMANTRGFLVKIAEYPADPARPRTAPAAVRAGHITWRDAAAMLRASTPDDGALFDLEVS